MTLALIRYGVSTLAVSLSAAVAWADISANSFIDLQTAITNQETVISMTATPINWGTLLDLNYNLTINNPTNSAITFSGAGSNQALFATGGNSANPIIIWNGNFIFDSAIISPDPMQGGVALGTALMISPPTMATGNSTVIFNGNATFTNNAINDAHVAVGGALVNYQSALTFNGSVIFSNNVVNGTGTLGNPSIAVGGALISSGSVLTFNQPSSFSGNVVNASGGGLAMAGAIAIAIKAPSTNLNSTAIFNAPATFINNSVTNTASSGNNAYGGALALPLEANVMLVNPQFLNNQVNAPNSTAQGGAIFLDNSAVTITATDPSTPVLFQGNRVSDALGIRYEAIYLSAADLRAFLNQPQASIGPATLILNTEANTLIDMQDGVASDGGGLNSVTSQIEPNQIIKQGTGTWQQGGNSSGYQDNTTIQAGTWQLQPGAQYGSTAKGIVSLAAGSNLTYNIAVNQRPLLQARTFNINGAVNVLGGNQIAAHLAPGQSSVAQPVAITGTPIYVNGTPAISGNVLGQTSLPFYNYQLTFSSPTQLNLIVQRSALTFAQAAGSSVNTQGVAHALDSISPSALTGELGAYAINMLQAQTIAQAASMLQAIQGETLTGGYSALQGHIQAFGTQLDQRLNMATRSAQTEQTATSLLASLENDLPAHHFAKATPWGAWAQVMGSWGQRSEHEASNSYRSGASGLSIGFDRAIDSWRLGMALNTQHSVLDWQQNQAQTKADTLALALYGAYNNENWYVRGQINAGRALTHNRRNIPISSSTNLTANADSTLRFFGTRLSTGYRLHQGDLHMTPSLGLAYLHSHTNAYTESGAGNLNLQVGSARLNNLEAQANFEIKHIDMINGRRIAPRASVGFGYELWDKQINLDTSFAAFANLPAFSATSPDMGRWRSLLGLGIDIDVAKNARIFIDYLGIFKRYEYTHTGIASFKLVF